MILIPSWVTTEEGKEAIGPELPIQTEMRILSSVDQKPRVRQDDRVPAETLGIRCQVCQVRFLPCVWHHIS